MRQVRLGNACVDREVHGLDHIGWGAFGRQDAEIDADVDPLQTLLCEGLEIGQRICTSGIATSRLSSTALAGRAGRSSSPACRRASGCLRPHSTGMGASFPKRSPRLPTGSRRGRLFGRNGRGDARYGEELPMADSRTADRGRQPLLNAPRSRARRRRTWRPCRELMARASPLATPAGRRCAAGAPPAGRGPISLTRPDMPPGYRAPPRSRVPSLA